MFGALVRGVLVLVAGSLLFVLLSVAGAELLDVQQSESMTDLGPEATENWQWGEIVIEWWPAFVIATAAAILIGSAIARRERVSPR